MSVERTVRDLRILIVENEEEWRDLIVRMLREPGFESQAVESLEEAREALAREFFHLLILDIHLDTQEQSDQGGMDLLRELSESGKTKATKVVMLTGFGTMEKQREAFKEHDVLDFVDKKDFDGEKLVTGLREFISDLRINLALQLHWPPALNGPEEAVLGMRLAGETIGRSKRKEASRLRAASELEDLFCRLFHEAQEVVIESLSKGCSQSGLLLAQPLYEKRGGGQAKVVKYGDVDAIHQEAENYRLWVAGFVGGSRSTRLEAERQTPLLGGLCFSLVGARGEAFETWRGFVRGSTLEQQEQTLTNLFFSTCDTWYANAGSLEVVDLAEEYSVQLGYTVKSLKTAFERGLPSVQGKETVLFESLPRDRRFRNPLGVLESRRPITRMTYRCTTHGDLNADNVIVEDSGATWLIDFQRTGPGHILRDFVQLDATMRFELLGEHEATLEERLDLEEALLGCDRFQDLHSLELESGNSRLQETFRSCMLLRQMSARPLARRGKDDFSEFQLASFFLAINWIRRYGMPRLQREHAFLSAALLADYLGI